MKPYPIPPALSFDRLFGERGLLSVRYAKEAGFEFEVRFDLAEADRWRQPFTGAQTRLGWKGIDGEPAGTYRVGGASARFDRGSGALVVRDGGVEFDTGIAPFAAHDSPVELCEGINSLKMPDLAGNTPPGMPLRYYESRMLRFQYARPAGQVLGLPGQTGELDRNGYRFELYTTDEPSHTPGRPPMYQAWPIVFHQVKGGWTAIFFDNPSRTFVDIGEFDRERLTFEATHNNLRVYVLLGKSLAEVSAKLVRLLGRPACPPRWAFGYQQCRWSYESSDEIRRIVREMKAHGMPLHAIYFDIDYMDGFRLLTHDKKRFPDFYELLRELRRENVRPVAIIDPGVKVDEHYAFFKEFKRSGAVLRKKNGEPLIARVWPGDTVLPDFADARASALWKRRLSEWLRRARFAGIWNDMNEPANFDGGNAATDESFTARGSLRLDHNLYGYWMAKASAEALRAVEGGEGLAITRSGYPGVQQFAVLWHGDNSTWWEHLALALRTALQYSLCGMFFTGADLPGFFGNAPDDLAVRFYQLGAFLPFFRGHSWKYANDKEPFAFGREAREHIKAAILLRERMLGEWAAEFKRAAASGKSPLTPVFDARGRLVDHQFVLFDRYLVAPVIERAATRRLLYLPKGHWKRFAGTKKGSAVRGGRWITEKVDLASIPVFCRA